MCVIVFYIWLQLVKLFHWYEKTLMRIYHMHSMKMKYTTSISKGVYSNENGCEGHWYTSFSLNVCDIYPLMYALYTSIWLEYVF